MVFGSLRRSGGDRNIQQNKLWSTQKQDSQFFLPFLFLGLLTVLCSCHGFPVKKINPR